MAASTELIDLRSDTVTKPSLQMRSAMASAEVGDDVYSDDPSKELIAKIAASLPEKPSVRRKKLQEAWQVPDKEMAAMINADVLDSVEATVKRGVWLLKIM